MRRVDVRGAAAARWYLQVRLHAVGRLSVSFCVPVFKDGWRRDEVDTIKRKIKDLKKTKKKKIQKTINERRVGVEKKHSSQT